MNLEFVSLTLYFVITISLPLNIANASSCSDCDGNVTCVDGVCLPRCVNVTSSGECFQCRDSRFYGKQCKNVCSQNCLNFTCQLNNSRVVCTEGCAAGKKGDNCGVDCPTSCTQCERYGDRCLGKCSSFQYYGDYCNETCSSNCTGGCHKHTGVCETCKPGYRGKYCYETCPSNCRAGCDINTGVCETCKPGNRGKYCNETCPSNCAQCDQHVDTCSECLNNKHHDITCRFSCQGHCVRCFKNTSVCNHCNDGYTGEWCNVTCPPNCRDACFIDSGACHNCKEGFIGIYCEIELDLIWKITGICLMVVVVIGTVLLGILLLKRRRLKNISNDVEFQDTVYSNNIVNCETPGMNRSKSHINPTYGLTKDCELKFVNYCDELQSDDDKLNVDYILNEFAKLPPPDSRLAKCGSHEENTYKNRYRDVLPFDDTRVSLQAEDQGDRDYINASYINGYRSLIRYVAAQGPSLQVIDDFWRMIWQLNATKIVMLTNLVEAGKVKCEMYWPFCSSEYQAFGKVCVQCVEEKVYQYYTLRTLAVWKGKAKTRTVRQFHFTAWPDHGVPEETKSIIDFHRVVKDTGPNALGPMVIHCSAGVGRSGTFIALDYLLDQARYEGSVCIFKCVQNFRFQRMKMVQTKEQYRFVYDMLANALQYRGTLPLYYSPVLIQCEECWDKKNNPESRDDDTSLEENDQEYQPLWNCGMESRDSFLPGSLKSLSDVCAVISEDSPPLLKTPIQMQLEEDDKQQYDNEMEKQRISWDTAL